MILSDPTTASVRRTSPGALLVLGAFSLSLLPGATWGGTPTASDPVAADQAPTGDPPVKAAAPRDENGDAPKAATPRDAVRVTQPLVREVTDHAEFAGHIVAAREVEVRARASGTIIEARCRPGQVVKSGERLFKIDPRQYKAALDQAQAQLEQTRARRSLRESELAAAKKLADRNAVSHEEAQRLEIQLLEADAAARVAEAARDVSRLKLELTEVTAPFAGRIGGPVLGEGNVAVADTTPLATIVSTDQVWATFNVPEKIVLRFRRQGPEPFEGKGETAVGLADGADYPHRGKIESTEVGIDAATGAARWRALVPNPDGLLLPGMSVRVRMVTSAPHKAILVPEQATLENDGRASVFVVSGQDIVQARPVKIGPVYDGFRSVDGLHADEWVVVDGVRGLREGAKVQAKRVPPPAEPSSPPRDEQ